MAKYIMRELPKAFGRGKRLHTPRILIEGTTNLRDLAEQIARGTTFAAAEVDLNKMREYGKMSANPADAIGYQGFALRGLGYIAVERKQWDKALGFYNEALKLNPNDDKAKAEIDFIRHSRR